MERQPRSNQEAENLGGFDPADWIDDHKNQHYSEKPNHAERSIHHQPNHIKHFRNGLSGRIVFPKPNENTT